MVLVTGPTGSGKTTTLYAALSEIKNDEDKIITIEDPVEYQIRGITQIPVNEKKGLTFARGLRSILRHDPDKILVGEIRDQETAQIAINAALTGHLVFTTVHANNVLDVLGRFLNMGVEPYNFVSALNCILAQRLVRMICPHCKRTGHLSGFLSGRERLRSRTVARRAVLRRRGLLRVRRHRIPRTQRDFRTARPERQHPRSNPQQATGHGSPPSGARRRDDLPARIGRREGPRGNHHAQGDQQGHLHRRVKTSSYGIVEANHAPGEGSAAGAHLRALRGGHRLLAQRGNRLPGVRTRSAGGIAHGRQSSATQRSRRPRSRASRRPTETSGVPRP